jgi:hypothetical protein
VKEIEKEQSRKQNGRAVGDVNIISSIPNNIHFIIWITLGSGIAEKDAQLSSRMSGSKLVWITCDFECFV